ncbi:MAG: extracellular solute-binding protein [Alphaproteobacteria bacterium]
MTRFMIAVLTAAALFSGTSAEAAPEHAIAMHGAPKYGPDFKHFDYANPNAPKGGDVNLAAIGTYDNLNPFILKGISAAGSSQVFETLMESPEDEAFSEYGLLAETVETPPDRSWVIFTLRKEARWHDGKPVTPDDVIFSANTLKTKGHPFYRAYYASIDTVTKVGARAVKFTFSDTTNRELPLIVGQIPILPKHYWQDRDFTKTTLEPPLGSGPYKVGKIDAGRSITYERVADYWGANIPVNKGRYNFDSITYDYYRDGTVALEALKSNNYDFRQENISKNWATAYDIEQVRDGRMKKLNIGNEQPTGMQAFVFNTRRPQFTDHRVREAISYLFDFEWTNKTLFYGQYTRTSSYFSNSELASSGLPGKAELEILEPWRGKIPDQVFTKEYTPPKTDGSGSNIRDNQRAAFRLLKQAGYTFKGDRMVGADGTPLEFEILLNQPIWERIALPFVKNLAKLGIIAKVRTVDAAQYQKRMEAFDFDMVVDVFGQSLSPGNEQRDMWTSDTADTNGSRNTIGVKDPVVDALVDLVIAAPDRETLIARTRALDRVLLWGHYVVPHWHIQSFRVAYWDKFGRPPQTPKYGLCFSCWWIDDTKAAALKTSQGKN